MILLKNPGGRVSWEPDSIANEMLETRVGFEKLYEIPGVFTDQLQADIVELTDEQVREIREMLAQRNIDPAIHGLTIGTPADEAVSDETDGDTDAKAKPRATAKPTKPRS